MHIISVLMLLVIISAISSLRSRTGSTLCTSFLLKGEEIGRSIRLYSTIRPSLDDVERISKGLAANRRGTGSRGVPHRLNSLERAQWDIAKKKKFLVLRGSGYRKERGDSPLANIYRQFCDSTNIPAINICQGLGTGEIIEDTVVVDFSPLRRKDLGPLVDLCKAEAQKPEYKSIVDVQDATESSSFEDLQMRFDEEPIWKVPVLSLELRFLDRAESKKYAEAIASTL